MRDTHQDPSSTMHAGRLSASLGAPRTRDRQLAEARVVLVAEDLRFRLRNVCSHWDETEFEALVLQIARMKVRWTDYDRAD